MSNRTSSHGASLGADVAALARIAGPLVAHGLVTVVVTVNDTVLLGRVAPEVLGASAASSAVVMVGVLLLAGLCGTPTQILVARAVGAGDHDRAGREAERAVPLAIAASVLLAIAMLALAPVLMPATGGSAIDAELATGMLRVHALALPLTGLAAIGRGFASGVGATRVVLVSALAAAVVDVGSSLVLRSILGPIGVTIGTVLAAAASLSVFVVWSRRRKGLGLAAPRILRAIAAVPGRAQRVALSLGWSEGLLGATSAGAGIVVTLVLSTSPPEVLAASRSLESMLMIAWMVLMPVSSAGLTLLAQARGASDGPRYRRALVATVLVSGAIGLVLVLALPLATVPLLDVAVGERIARAAAGVVWLAWAQAGWIVVTTIALSVCRSFRDTRTPMWASLASEYAVFLPAGWLLCRVWEHGIVGLFVAHHVYYLAFAAIAVTSAVAHLRRDWTRPSRFERELEPSAA